MDKIIACGKEFFDTRLTGEPLWKLPFIIRWNRIGKLIRDWDGVEELNGKIKY